MAAMSLRTLALLLSLSFAAYLTATTSADQMIMYVDQQSMMPCGACWCLSTNCGFEDEWLTFPYYIDGFETDAIGSDGSHNYMYALVVEVTEPVEAGPAKRLAIESGSNDLADTCYGVRGLVNASTSIATSTWDADEVCNSLPFGYPPSNNATDPTFELIAAYNVTDWEGWTTVWASSFDTRFMGLQILYVGAECETCEEEGADADTTSLTSRGMRQARDVNGDCVPDSDFVIDPEEAYPNCMNVKTSSTDWRGLPGTLGGWSGEIGTEYTLLIALYEDFCGGEAYEVLDILSETVVTEGDGSTCVGLNQSGGDDDGTGFVGSAGFIALMSVLGLGAAACGGLAGFFLFQKQKQAQPRSAAAAGKPAQASGWGRKDSVSDLRMEKVTDIELDEGDSEDFAHE